MWIDALLQDVRYGVRTIRRAPGFAAIAIASSSLGIGACSILFAILNVAILRPLPVDEPARLVSLSEADRRTGDVGNELSYPDLLDVRRARAFEGVAAVDPLLAASIGAEGDPERQWGALVTANYFAIVRPRFALGRGFDAARDDRPGERPVVVLSHELWSAHFGRDRGIIGRSVLINGRAASVVGVTDAGFRGTIVGVAPAFWIPFSMLDEVEGRLGPVSTNRDRHWLNAVARLAPGVVVDAARAELDVLASTMNAARSDGNPSRRFHLEQAGRIDLRLRRMTLTLFTVGLAASVLVLLAACANVANLLLGRAAARRRELAARMALGASRTRLARQLLIESLLLALAGGAAGWGLAAYGAALLSLQRVPFGWPLDVSVSLDYRVTLVSVALSIATGLIFGLLPALRATRPDLVSDLKADGRSSSSGDRFGLRGGLVIAQVGICTLLLLCTGLFLRSLQVTRGMDVGFAHRNLLLLSFDPALDHRSDAQARRLLERVLAAAREVPGVESATLTTGVPLTFIVNNSEFQPDRNASGAGVRPIPADIYGVDSEYFDTLGIARLSGEGFRSGETQGQQVIVNEAFARAAFAGGSPIGRRIAGDGKGLIIAGVVATSKSRTIGEAPRPCIYLPILSTYSARDASRGVTLLVRPRGSAVLSPEAVRAAIRRTDPSLAVFDVQSMESHLRDALVVPRLAGGFSSLAGAVGLAIAAIGVYGIISVGVARRRREIGIRLALGATPGEIVRMIVTHGVRLTVSGAALGLLAGFGVTRYIASLLYGVTPTDAVSFLAVTAVLLAMGLLACLLPARGAARQDPVDVLRSE